MTLYLTKSGPVVEYMGDYYRLSVPWDTLINQFNLEKSLQSLIADREPLGMDYQQMAADLEVPIVRQELWASGVTYFNSKLAREAESEATGGSTFYARVYEADRPELFFKATRHRCVPPGGTVRIRRDSAWNVPEPELTLVVNARAEIIGYTIGNDMSSRDIEGENPLYLPQAKTYDGCASVGPGILLTNQPLPSSTQIFLQVERDGQPVFTGQIGIDQMKRRPADLVKFLFAECSFPHGVLLMTGTGIVPDSGFSLRRADVIRISIDGLGTLVNTVG